MCLQPITIPNKSRFFDPQTTPLYNTVACGKCMECRDIKATSWNIRAYYEYKDTINCRGFVLFVTLTYNPSHLPVYELIDTNTGELNYIPCFSKSDIQSFHNKLRKQFKRDKGYDLPIKYLLTCEYGGNTHRPHYHALYFIKLPQSYAPYIRSLIRQKWDNGFISFGKNQGIVYSNQALKYVTKYICKDLDFLPISNKIKYLIDDNERFIQIKNEIFPFHLQSVNLGANALLYDNNNEIIDEGKIYIPTSQGLKPVPIPLYLERKYFYTYDKELRTYQLNERGLKSKLTRLSKTKENFLKHYNKVFDNVQNYLNDNVIKNINHLLNTNYDRNSIIDSLANVRDDDKFINYLFNERNYLRLAPHPVTNTLVENIVLSKEQQLITKYHNQYQHDGYDWLRTIDNPLRVNYFGETIPFPNEFFTNRHSSPYEPLAKLFDAIQSQFGSLKNAALIEEDKKRRENKTIKSHYQNEHI